MYNGSDDEPSFKNVTLMLSTLAMINLTSHHWVWAVAILVLALAAIILYYRRTVPPLRAGIKVPLGLLRATAAVALFLALAEALWSAILVDHRPRELWVLLDRSASMQQKDGADQDRLSRAVVYLKDKIHGRLGDRSQVVSSFFDDHVFDPKDKAPDSLGSATAIGDVLDQLHARPVEFDPPRACVLLSDGANNRGIDPAAAASRLGYPVVAVGFGLPGAAQAQIAGIDVPDVVFTGAPFDLTAALESGGGTGDVTVRLSAAGRTIDQKTITLTGRGMRLPIALRAQFDTPGIHDLRADVIGADGQPMPAAGRSAFVHALKGRLKVLLIGCELDWEYATLSRWLAHEARVELMGHVIGKPEVGGALPTASEWDNIDVAIFLHPSRDQLQTYWAPHSAAFAHSGKGAVFLLNDRFNASGSAVPPHPLEFCREARPPIHGEAVSEPASTRQNHPLVRLDPNGDWEATRRLWMERPPWAVIVPVDSMPADCDVLVRARPSSANQDFPVVWTRPLKQGRSITIAAGPMWRWVPSQAAHGLAPDEYNSFWANALRWLTLPDQADRLAVRSDQQIYHSGEPINLEGLVFDEAYRFLDRAEVTARAWAEGTTDTARLTLNPGAGDRFVGTLSALPPGTYHYDGHAQVEGATLPLSGGMFRVESYGLEQQYSGLDEATLRSVARESGGRYYAESDAPAFLDSLDWTPAEHQTSVEVPLGNHWLVLSIFVVTLSIEWFIRRRRQLL